MTKEEIEQCALSAFGVTKNSGFVALKSTVPGTCHVGKLSGNRLNSSTLRSQLLFCLDAVDWNNTDASIKKLFHEDQRIFVQTEDDQWDVYKGIGYDETTQPIMWKHISGMRAFLSDLANLELVINSSQIRPRQPSISGNCLKQYNYYLAAIRTKPFVLLAGISGTGKSRMVRELARGCCPEKDANGNVHPLCNEQKPGNFEMIPVRPNWHDSTELMGYVSRINGKDEYQITDFVKFLCKAWRYEQEGIPFFLCLDEMNLAPVEQYFAEYLSVIETRKHDANGKIVTDPLIRFKNEMVLQQAVKDAYASSGLTQNEIDNYITQFKEAGGIPIPSNFVVMGTVNMDETTFSFSRKVLDRAMSFELNEVVMTGGLEQNPDIPFGSLSGLAMPTLVKGFEAYQANKDICDKVVKYLESVNGLLEGTPFKVAYRTRDEVMIYCIERCGGGVELAQALDEATSMKVLSRIEGDSLRLVANDNFTTPVGYDRPTNLLGQLKIWILEGLKAADDANKDFDGETLAAKYPICAKKLKWMAKRLAGGFTGFWQ